MTTETHSHRWRIPTGISPQVGVCACGESRIFATSFDETVRPTSKGKKHATGYSIQGANLGDIPSDMRRQDGGPR